MIRVFANKFIGVDNVSQNRTEVNLAEARLAATAFDLRNPQQRFECIDHAVNFGQCLVRGFTIFFDRRGRTACRVETLANPANGGFKIVGNVG